MLFLLPTVGAGYVIVEPPSTVNVIVGCCLVFVTMPWTSTPVPVRQ